MSRPKPHFRQKNRKPENLFNLQIKALHELGYTRLSTLASRQLVYCISRQPLSWGEQTLKSSSNHL